MNLLREVDKSVYVEVGVGERNRKSLLLNQFFFSSDQGYFEFSYKENKEKMNFRFYIVYIF